MARVFVSYRRADGPYGVGWLAERLRSLDSITGVETAFHDAALRAGDDFPDALEREIAGSDLVVAVIGPHWWGRSDHGPSRIEDPDDWVVRELAIAFEQGTTVVPVVLGGADHPLASEVHSSIAGLARLHTLPFLDGRDLDTIVDHIESHLGEMDRERARLTGLEAPVEVPPLRHLPALVVGSALAASVGGVLGAVSAGVLSPWPFDGSTTDAVDGTTAHGWMVGLLIALGVASGAFTVFGVAILVRLTRFVDIEWAKVGLVFAAAGGVALVLVASSQAGDLVRADPPTMPDIGLRIAVSSTLALVAVAPWAICLIAPFGSEPRAGEHEVGRRVQTLALSRDAERWGVVASAVVLTMSGAAGTALLASAYHAHLLPSFEVVPNVGFAALESLLLVLAHVAAVTRLRDQQLGVGAALQELPPRYRENALPRLAATALDDRGWAFRLLLCLPVAVAAVGTIAVIATAP